MTRSRDRPILSITTSNSKKLNYKLLWRKNPMSKTFNAKRIISIILAIVMLSSTLVISVSAASYSTGTYKVATSSGVNVRSGAGTGYSIVGAASNGVSFTVSKISGSWGYTTSIKCTNGTKSGWVCLDNCSKQSSSSGGGSSSSYTTGTYTVTPTNGVNVRSGAGTGYSIVGAASKGTSFSVSKISGSWGYTSSIKCTNGTKSGWVSLSNCSKQGSTSTTTYYTLTYNANGGSNAPSSQKVTANTNFYLSSSRPTRSGYTFLGWTTDKNASSASYTPGQCVKINSNITLYAVWKSNTVNPTSVSLSFSSCTLSMGGTKTLTATVYPSNANNKSVTWSSSNSSVVSVSNGKITAKSLGTATITAKTSNGKTATCKVTVTGVSINGSYYLNSFYTTPYVGDVHYLTATSYPSSSSFTWSSSNSNVVSITSSGKMTAKAAGTAIITARTPDGKSASVTITVRGVNYWKTGNFDSGYTAKGYTTVKLNTNKGDGYIYVYTYDSFGKKTSGQIHVTLRDGNGKWICEFDTSSGARLKLGSDHEVYRVYIAKKQYPNNVIGQGDDFINVGKCQSWGINCSSNCYIG